ncbi:MAG TPA: MFS transporter [Gaiellaceae bacterium]|nr:MFS transporter [Gaiellaceae bacterium]
MRPSVSLAALRERNLALIIGSATVSSLGSGMAQVALAFAVLRIGNASDLGFVFLAREIPIVVFLLLGGIWADRVSRKWLLVMGDATTGAAQALTALLFLTGHAAIWNVALLQVVFGTANAFTRPASTGLVPQAVSPAHLQHANALSDLSRSTMRVIGPALGAAIVVVANPGWALAADAASFIVSGALLAQLRIASADRPERKRFVADLREGWGEFRARTWVWVMVSSFGFFQLTLFPALLVLGPVIAQRHLGGAGAWGAILAFQAAGSVAGGLISLRLRPARPLFASCLLMLPTAGFLAILGAAAPVWVLCLAGFIASAGLTSGDILWVTTFQREIPEHLLSRLSSFDWLGSVALNPIGYALVGPLAGQIGVVETIYLAAAINAAVSLVAATVPSIRRLHAEPTPPPTPPT